MEVSRAHTVLSIRGIEGRYVVPTKSKATSLRRDAVQWLYEKMREWASLHTYLSCVNYYDRAVAAHNGNINVSGSSLLRAACLLVAGKLEEVEGPTLQQLSQWSGHSSDEVITGEIELCRILDMELLYPSPVYFLDYITSLLKEAPDVKATALNIIEFFSFSDDNSKHTPSCIATCAVWISRNHHKAGDWTHLHVAFTGYTSHQLHQALHAWNAIDARRLPRSCVETFQSMVPMIVWQP